MIITNVRKNIRIAKRKKIEEFLQEKVCANVLNDYICLRNTDYIAFVSVVNLLLVCWEEAVRPLLYLQGYH